MFIPQTQAASRDIRADRVQRCLAPIPGAASRLAVNRDHARDEHGKATDPRAETGLEHRGVQQAETRDRTCRAMACRIQEPDSV